MALVYSQMLGLGTKLIDFELPNVMDGSMFSTHNISDKPALIMFICNHCPYVIHYHQQLQDLVHNYGDKVVFIAISANDVKNYPEDSQDNMKLLFNKLSLTFPYLYDETQEVAQSYKAVCTPDFYLFNQDKSLVYRGRLDDSSPGNGKEITGQDLRSAMDNMLLGQQISTEQYPSMGCSIKWK